MPLVRPAPLWFEVAGRRIDLTTRALVVGVPTAGLEPTSLVQEARRLAGQGADLLDLRGATGAVVAAIVAELDVPALADRPPGAVLAGLAGGAGPALLHGAAEAGASVLLGAAAAEDVGTVLPGQLMAARAAGVAEERIALDVGGHVEAVVAVVSLGRPVGIATSELGQDGHPEASVAITTVGVRLGARIVRTGHVQAVRRTVDVLAALLEGA